MIKRQPTNTHPGHADNMGGERVRGWGEKERELRCGGSPSKRKARSFLVPPGTGPEP